MSSQKNFIELDFTDQIKNMKAGEDCDCANENCPTCGCMPCICGSRKPQNQHKNLEELAEKIVPLVDEINEELIRHAAVCRKRRMWGDKDAGYPPHCKKGFVEKDGKCVPEKKDEATHDSRKKSFHGPASYSELWKKVNATT